jgi:hypothetical protein
MLKILHTKLREDFGLLDRRLIRTELLAETGIHSVSYEPARNCLSIEYDPDLVNDAQLLDIICRHGVYPDPGGPRSDGAPRTDG